MRHVRIFLAAWVALFLAAPAQALDARKPAAVGPAPQVEAGKAKIVPLAALPPELKRVVEDELQRLRKTDGVLVQDLPGDEALALKTLRQRVRPQAEVEGRSKSPLADLSRSALAGYRFHGIVPDGPTRSGPWSSFIRLYERPDGVLVALHEWDFVADGGGVLSVQELMNASVAGQPAQLVVRRSAAGDAVTEPRWVARNRIFTLTAFEDVRSAAPGYGRDWLTAIAAAIR